jgi:type III secretion system chaperone SycN
MMAYTHVINEFMRRLGLPQTAPEPGKPVQLHINGMGTLFIEEQTGQTGADEDVLLYLARSFPEHDREAPLRALALCHYGYERPYTVQAGLYKENVLFFLIRFAAKDFSIQTLERAIPELSSLLDKTSAGAY